MKFYRSRITASEYGANQNMDRKILKQLQAEEISETRWPSDDIRDRSPVVGSKGPRKPRRNRKVRRRQADPQPAKEQRRLYECRGKIQGSYPIYLPLAPSAVLWEKLVQDAHMLTLHGRVGLTMALIRLLDTPTEAVDQEGHQ